MESEKLQQNEDFWALKQMLPEDVEGEEDLEDKDDDVEWHGILGKCGSFLYFSRISSLSGIRKKR